MSKKLLVNLPAELHAAVAKIAIADDRPVSNMIVRLVRIGLDHITSSDHLIPVKSDDRQSTITPSDMSPQYALKPQRERARNIIPDGIPLRVVMDGVQLVDDFERLVSPPGNPASRVYDSVPMMFDEVKSKSTGEWIIRAKAVTRFVSPEGVPVDRMEVVPGTWVTEWSPQIVDKDGTIDRWLSGDYRLVDDWEQHELRVTVVEGGKLAARPQPLPNMTGNFVPSPDQLAEYRERGWDDEGVALFIELRSAMPTAVYDFHDRLVDINRQVDAFMASREGDK